MHPDPRRVDAQGACHELGARAGILRRRPDLHAAVVRDARGAVLRLQGRVGEERIGVFGLEGLGRRGEGRIDVAGADVHEQAVGPGLGGGHERLRGDREDLLLGHRLREGGDEGVVDEHDAVDLGTRVVRDVGDDARRGRIYLPISELQQFDVKAHEILKRERPWGYSDRFQALMRFQAERAHRCYDEALAWQPLGRFEYQALPVRKQRGVAMIAVRAVRAVSSEVMVAVMRSRSAANALTSSR